MEPVLSLQALHPHPDLRSRGTPSRRKLVRLRHTIFYPLLFASRRLDSPRLAWMLERNRILDKVTRQCTPKLCSNSPNQGLSGELIPAFSLATCLSLTDGNQSPTDTNSVASQPILPTPAPRPIHDTSPRPHWCQIHRRLNARSQHPSRPGRGMPSSFPRMLPLGDLAGRSGLDTPTRDC